MSSRWRITSTDLHMIISMIKAERNFDFIQIHINDITAGTMVIETHKV